MNTTPRSRRSLVLAAVASIFGLNTGSARKTAVSPMQYLPEPHHFTPKVTLSGLEIASIRKQAARSQLGTTKRRNCYLPHVGQKQQAKAAARLATA